LLRKDILSSLNKVWQKWDNEKGSVKINQDVSG
jgi:hypothetical protein